jgi:(p)ppGpp synthase/HD superfamily hydrolase
MIGGLGLDRATANYIINVILQDRDVKAELAKQIRIETETAKNKYSQYNRASFDSLTSGDVNLQYRMAQSGYDVYGRTILSGHTNTSNKNVYQKMKNKIRYGKQPESGYRNRGGFTVG